MNQLKADEQWMRNLSHRQEPKTRRAEKPLAGRACRRPGGCGGRGGGFAPCLQREGARARGAGRASSGGFFTTSVAVGDGGRGGGLPHGAPAGRRLAPQAGARPADSPAPPMRAMAKAWLFSTAGLLVKPVVQDFLLPRYWSARGTGGPPARRAERHPPSIPTPPNPWKKSRQAKMTCPCWSTWMSTCTSGKTTIAPTFTWPRAPSRTGGATACSSRYGSTPAC